MTDSGDRVSDRHFRPFDGIRFLQIVTRPVTWHYRHLRPCGPAMAFRLCRGGKRRIGARRGGLGGVISAELGTTAFDPGQEAQVDWHEGSAA